MLVTGQPVRIGYCGGPEPCLAYRQPRGLKTLKEDVAEEPRQLPQEEDLDLQEPQRPPRQKDTDQYDLETPP